MAPSEQAEAFAVALRMLTERRRPIAVLHHLTDECKLAELDAFAVMARARLAFEAARAAAAAD